MDYDYVIFFFFLFLFYLFILFIIIYFFMFNGLDFLNYIVLCFILTLLSNVLHNYQLIFSDVISSHFCNTCGSCFL